MTRVLITAIASMLLASAPALAGDAEAGQRKAKPCAACHGPDGNSVSPEFPRIAGQHYDYLVKALERYKSGERKNPIMAAMAQPLAAEDMRAVAAYYSAQKPRPGAARNKETVAVGQKLYRGGNAESGVPACSACHGPAGGGIPAQFPQLSGQHARYTAAQLRAFRSVERANDPNQMMRAIAARMSEQEIAAVADYIAGLH